ncbi:phage major capsid protein [Novosphingobium sp. JCM 18896]|uniref:phage major capsid protein n=1 Tax=Novosphingobium sp. JCM 18896 TaxID=2989731 RepID=UPI002221A04B|nr:phage major capsid protein [Novosphingobium sp. JCM 18896]MCW1431392.1 phage major capsid protein [Novosphingobium sp. JCM 18896]
MTTETKSAAELAAETKALFDRRFDEVKGLAEDALGKIRSGEELTAATKELADQAITGMNEAKARMDELEQKMALRPSGDQHEAKSAGYLFTENENVKQFLANGGRGKVVVEMEAKAIISSLTTDANGSAGDLVVPQRGPLVSAVERRMTVRDLLTPGRTSSSSIQYPKETGFTNSAATHTETAGTTKPQSEIKFDIATANVTTIAHFVKATRQIMDDVPALQSYIDGRLRYGLAYAEELQLLNGDGTGTNLNGIYTQATALASNPAVITTPTKIDVLRVAILQATLAELPATGIVVHPTDWMGIETTKDSAGNYIVGDPSSSIQPRLWSLPVVQTQAMTVDKFLVGAFRMGAQIFDRMDARVELSTEDGSNFVQNLITILCEERLALAVYRPEAFTKGDFSDAITDLTS